MTAPKSEILQFYEILQCIKFEPFDHTELFIRLSECKNEEVDLDLVLNL